MKKNYFLLLCALAGFSGKALSQVKPCGTDEVRKELIAKYPELLKVEAEYERQIQNKILSAIKNVDLSKAKTTVDTSTGEKWFDIPIVVHIIHDYNAYNLGAPGGDYITDDQVFNAVASWNRVFAKQNPDTIDVIAPFKKYVGNPRIRLHLATIDPQGKPTKGITRRRSYLTYTGGQSSKFDDWQPTSYVNIWFINTMNSGSATAAAYAHLPADATYIPYYDGVISLAEYLDKSKTINHELGHVFNLIHTWGGTNEPGVECGDDNVDDTPPTRGHAPTGCIPAAVYDTTCARNYFKVYTTATGVTLVNYPDTANSQNIMDYTYCDKMFSKGQVERMHATLESSVAGRSNLHTPENLAATGALAGRPDLKPVPDFMVSPTIFSGYQNKNAFFVFPNTNVRFTNFTYNDTVQSLRWTFSNGAEKPTDTSKTFVINKFSSPGWVTVSMKATGNNTGDSTRTWDKSVFVADLEGRAADNYYMEFDAAGDRDKWPMFNYYNNEFKWQHSSYGYYDNSGVMYSGFDSRLNPTLFQYPLTGSPVGDFDDMYSVPMNLADVSGGYLNFYSASASRSASSVEMNDSLIIDYSVNKGSWVNLSRLAKGELHNNGAQSTAFAPTWMGQWKANAIKLPAGAISPYTTFRFRYKPGVGTTGYSTGNNFYMDRVNFSRIPAGVNEAALGALNVAVLPNPTHGNAYVIVKDANNVTAQIVVSDITGKTVYTTSQLVSGNVARIEIPQSAIAVKGMYLVQTTTGNQTNTQKLVVY